MHVLLDLCWSSRMSWAGFLVVVVCIGAWVVDSIVVRSPLEKAPVEGRLDL